MRTLTKTKAELTYKHNIDKGRHGWLRLTPAYSIRVVHQILEAYPEYRFVLDPFSGTGTTGLVCGERGLRCDLLEINPFLIWFGRVKTSNYSPKQLITAKQQLQDVLAYVGNRRPAKAWLPPIKNIERWWSEQKLNTLAHIYEGINFLFEKSSPVRDLFLIAFCKTMIECSNAAFNHQSMSFKEEAVLLFDYYETDLLGQFYRNAALVIQSASNNISGHVEIILADSRQVPKPEHSLYDCVITSPPYPNRMSYIRELRPYMYWLGYLQEAREAGELDWQAIGGTWGIATSWVGRWKPNGVVIDHLKFLEMIHSIAGQSPLLANYVHKYFVDIVQHLRSLFPFMAAGGRVFYIVGNSKFYETIVPVEDIYANLLENVGFRNAEITVLRKRNSKKELYEFIVSAEKPS